MKRLLPILLLVFGVSASRAQQPDVRVRLFSLYKLTSVRMAPVHDAQIKWPSGGSDTMQAGTVITASGNSVVVKGRTGSTIEVSGEFRIGGDRMRTQRLKVPVRISARDGVLRLVAIFPMEDYVAAVLQGETAGNMPPEALKAIAVAIRSYATHFRERHKSEGLDFCDTTHCQYLRTEIDPAVQAAVTQTNGELVWERGTPIAAYYHKDCGGKTESAITAWPDQRFRTLASHEDPYCLRTAKPWKSEITRSALDQALRWAGVNLPAGWDRISVQERTPSGRARMLSFSVGGRHGIPASASTLRFAVGRSLGWSTLKSDLYEVSGNGDRFVFTGRGVGHGVGLCQTGAAEMAKQGRTYREILAFYYGGSALGRTAQDIPWMLVRGASFDVRYVEARDLPLVQSAAARTLKWAEKESGLAMRSHPVLSVYPSVSMFRDATGEPGWVAASTRGDHVRLEPPRVLGARLEPVLRHEFLHLLIENHARPDIPLWFREGLVIYLTAEQQPDATRKLSPAQIERAIEARRSEREVKEAYACAASIVRGLAAQFGTRRLMEWLRSGIPNNVLAASGVPSAKKEAH